MLNRKNVLGVGIGLAIAAILAGFIVEGRQAKREAMEEEAFRNLEARGAVDLVGRPAGKLLEGGNPAPSPRTAPVAKIEPPKTNASVARQELLLKRLAKISLDPKVENAIRSANDPVANDILDYLRARKGKKEFTPDELGIVTSALQSSLMKSPDAALPIVGRALSSLEAPENRQDRLDLLSLVGAFPPAENPEISRSAIATLAEHYASAGGAKAEDGFDASVTTIGAYLATTRAAPAAANAALLGAMGGKLDPSIRDAYQSMFSDRYPAASPRR